MFTVGGYEIKNSEDADNYSSNGYKYIYKGSPIPINIGVGADNKNLSTHTLSIYCIDKKALKDAGISEDITPSFFTQTNYNLHYYDLLCTWNADVNEKFSGWGINLNDRYIETDIDANVASISKQFVLDDSFDAGHECEFLVFGKDISGNDIIAANSKGYGFCRKVNETAPVIEVTLSQFSIAILTIGWC